MTVVYNINLEYQEIFCLIIFYLLKSNKKYIQLKKLGCSRKLLCRVSSLVSFLMWVWLKENHCSGNALFVFC